MSRFKVLVAGLAVVVLWASAFPAIRVAARDLGVIGPSVVRLAVASVSLLAVAPFAVRRSTSGCCPPRWGSCCGGYALANLPIATSTSLLYLVPAFAVLSGSSGCARCRSAALS